jgi:hypothetical protein
MSYNDQSIVGADLAVGWGGLKPPPPPYRLSNNGASLKPLMIFRKKEDKGEKRKKREPLIGSPVHESHLPLINCIEKLLAKYHSYL